MKIVRLWQIRRWWRRLVISIYWRFLKWLVGEEVARTELRLKLFKEFEDAPAMIEILNKDFGMSL